MTSLLCGLAAMWSVLSLAMLYRLFRERGRKPWAVELGELYQQSRAVGETPPHE